MTEPTIASPRRKLHLERFDCASRRCPKSAEGLAFTPEYATSRNERIESLLRTPRNALRLFRAARSMGLRPLDATRVLKDTLRSRPEPDALLEVAASALEGIAQESEHRLDAVECYSEYEFPLPRTLANSLDLPFRAWIEQRTRYFGEFAFELIAVVPYAYWLHEQGTLLATEAVTDTRCLYYFSPDHTEHERRRNYVPVTEYPAMRSGLRQFDLHGFPSRLDRRRWRPPPYGEVFRDARFREDRPVCVVCNKYTEEPSAGSGEALNYLTLPVLGTLLERLSRRYRVIYVRPTEQDIVGDHQSIGEFGDFDLIRRRHPEVQVFQELRQRAPELSYNEVQMRVFAEADCFVSVLGGSAVLASYFGGTNLVLAIDGWERRANAYRNWFQHFSGARVLDVPTHAELLELVDSELLGC